MVRVVPVEIERAIIYWHLSFEMSAQQTGEHVKKAVV